MDEMDYWRLCDELNVVQAALLVVGEAANLAEYAEGWDVDKRPSGYEAAKTAIIHALKKHKEYSDEIEAIFFDCDVSCSPDAGYLESLRGRAITGKLVPKDDIDFNGNRLGPLEGSVDLLQSTIEVDSLKAWLISRGFRQGFFFPEPVESADYLDPKNPRYAPKLAAAIRAWQAVTDPGNKSPKKALDKWLRENAADFGLTNDDGKPIEQAIEECSKVANWNQSGGAPKTPT